MQNSQKTPVKNYNFIDPENQCLSKSAFEEQKLIEILVIGDGQVGKTSLLDFISKYQLEFFNSNPQNIENLQFEIGKPQRTQGCDIHIIEIQPQQNQQNNNPKSNPTVQQYDFSYDSFVFRFWDLSGEKMSQQYVSMYVQQNLHQIRGILFVFDTSNLRTLQNLHKWLKVIYQNPQQNNIYNYLWDARFYIVGTKVDYLKKKNNLEIVKKKIYEQLNGIFNCPGGNNLSFFYGKATKQPENLYKNQHLIKDIGQFFNQLCDEYQEWNKNAQGNHNSEYLPKNLEKSPLYDHNNNQIKELENNNQKKYFSEEFDVKAFTLNSGNIFNKFQILDGKSLYKDLKGELKRGANNSIFKCKKFFLGILSIFSIYHCGRIGENGGNNEKYV